MHQILSHTPLYVWALLAFLVYRGVLASKERAVDIRKSCILPAAMLLLALFGLQAAGGLGGLTLLLWLAGGAVGAALVWRLADPAALVADAQRGVIVQRGSWAPLAMMLLVFATKYAVAVMLAMQPALRQLPSFVLTICLLYGLFSGVFGAGLVRRLLVYQRARRASGASLPV
jgi:hypothetical protein